MYILKRVCKLGVWFKKFFKKRPTAIVIKRWTNYQQTCITIYVYECTAKCAAQDKRTNERLRKMSLYTITH